ncbi:hypothetical protein KMZ30_07350 [Phycicoccus sp. KQZ13P-1]|uniref:hypothetical protein n=1 Tax=Phycicoccus mangrovi TaxID=2840470 RepID=UPI001C0039AE|nr:hypothetical protein [Phycicoccus mangrovi]MBT9255387.1 hypothetical protein [Phycicoccus mangrovi]
MPDYGHAHRKLRAEWEPIVAAGRVTCARCGEPIEPGQPWDLGHADDDPDQYNGPEHESCNRRAGGEKRAQMWGRPADHERWTL